jgi:hypothetical protein
MGGRARSERFCGAVRAGLWVAADGRVVWLGLHVLGAPTS